MPFAKVGRHPQEVINDWHSSRSDRAQPVMWQPAATADLPTPTDTGDRAPAIKGDQIYDSDTDNYKMFDGSSWVDFLDTTITIASKIGAFSSATAGSGIDLGTSDKAFMVYTDDGGVGTLTGNFRGFLSRMLLTIDNAANAPSFRAIMGQLKLVAGVDITHVNSVLAGVQGYLELAGAHTLAGQVAAGEFTIETTGIMTASSGAVVAGVASRLNAAVTNVATGNICAYYAGITGDAAGDKWPIGYFCPADAADIGFEAGIHSNSAGDGIALDAVTAANRFHADDGGTAGNDGNRRNLLARTLLSVTATAGVSYRSIVGQVKVLAGVGMSHANSVLAGVMGYLELAGASTFAGFVSAGEFTVEPGGVLTVSSGGVVCGVSALLNFTGTDSWTETGFAAAFYAGVTGDNEAANRRWPAAMHVNGCDVLIRGETDSDYEDGFKASVNTPSGNTTHALKFMVGSTAIYVPGYVADTF